MKISKETIEKMPKIKPCNQKEDCNDDSLYVELDSEGEIFSISCSNCNDHVDRASHEGDLVDLWNKTMEERPPEVPVKTILEIHNTMFVKPTGWKENDIIELVRLIDAHFEKKAEPVQFSFTTESFTEDEYHEKKAEKAVEAGKEFGLPDNCAECPYRTIDLSCMFSKKMILRNADNTLVDIYQTKPDWCKLTKVIVK